MNATRFCLCVLGLLVSSTACQTQRPTTTNVPTNPTVSTSLPDPRLTDIWVLRQLNGHAIDTTGMGQNVPYVELNTTTKTVVGHTGCNRLNGTFSTTGRSLRFGPVTTTRMACPGVSGVETELLATLKAVDVFQIGQNQLRLYRTNREMAVFQKAD